MGELRRIVRYVGFFLVGLVFAGLGLTVILALLNGRSFYGTSYYAQSLGVYETLSIFFVAAVVGAILAFRRIKSAYRGWRSRSSSNRP